MIWWVVLEWGDSATDYDFVLRLKPTGSSGKSTGWGSTPPPPADEPVEEFHGAAADAAIYGTIYFDDENNDVYVGDQWLGWVPVTLYDEDGNVVATTLTDANGDYAFEWLQPGEYSVGYTNNTDYTSDSSISWTHNEWEEPSITLISDIVIAAGDESTGNDFGLIGDDEELAAIYGTVYYDDEDDDQYAGDQWLAWVPVTLYDQNGNLVATTLTDANGDYAFESLQPGEYNVGYTNNTDYVSDSSIAWTNNESDLSQTPVKIEAIVVDAWEISVDNDFGLIDTDEELAAIYGGLYLDDEDDDQYVDDEWLAGIPVTLYDADGNIVATTTTAADGSYSFENLQPGEYSVGYTNSTSYTSDSSQPGTNSDNDGDMMHGAATSVTMIQKIFVDAGEESLANDFGLIAPVEVEELIEDVDTTALSAEVAEYQALYREAVLSERHLNTGTPAEDVLWSRMGELWFRLLKGQWIYNTIPSWTQVYDAYDTRNFDEWYSLLPAQHKDAGAYYVGYGTVMPIITDTAGMSDDQLLEELNDGVVMTPGSFGLDDISMEMIYGHTSSLHKSDFEASMLPSVVLATPGSSFAIYVKDAAGSYEKRTYIVDQIMRDVDPDNVEIVSGFNGVGKEYVILWGCQAWDLIWTLRARTLIVWRRVESEVGWYAKSLNVMYSTPKMMSMRSQIRNMIADLSAAEKARIFAKLEDLRAKVAASNDQQLRAVVEYMIYVLAYSIENGRLPMY